MTMSEAALAVVGARVRFGGNTALDGVDLAVEAGEILGLIGPNGAGKTTLLDAISGFAPLAAGRVVLGGEDITELLPYQRSRRGLGRSFQDARLWPTLTVRETLLCGFHPAVATTVVEEGLSLRRVAREEARIAEQAAQLLTLVDLHQYLDHLVGELSFGTTRAVELAWLAARQPRVLLLDEPAAGLQQSEVRELGAVVDAIRGEAAVVLIDHDVPFVAGTAHRLAALHLGTVVASGSAEEVLAHPDVVASYLGSGRYTKAGRP